MNRTQQGISLALSTLLLSSQIFAIDISYQSHISPSPIALDALRHKGGNAPRLTQANNAVPIVEIADANKAGISNNYFTDFNVGVEGLIFNNSKDLFVNTTLAGYIQGNSNLTQEASLILNQVTGSNPSSLLGVMEIAGKRADLIIANPNGITCKACGVLNAQSFTLSTGVISQAEIERVANSQDIRKTLTMMTERGHINIEALNASNVAKLNLIAKSVSVKGNLLAQDLQLILGKNKVFFDVNKQSDASLLLYETITTRGEGGEEQKALALDVAHLGSVVAKSIYLVATEEGVGVRNSGSMATIGSKEEGDGGFVIDVNGIVTLSTPQNNKSTLDKDGTSPSLISSSDLRIRAKELHNGSIISANNDISITADKVENKSRYEIKDVVVNYDETSWKVNMNINKIVVKTWTVEERIHNFSPAIIQSGGNLTIKATNITNDMGHLTAGANAVFDTKEKFENKAPELKTKIYKQEYKQYGITGKKEMRFEGLENQWYSKNNLPHYNTKDLILSTQSFILTQALEKIGEFNYTQENRKEYTDLSSFLSSSSFQEYLQSNSLHPTLITQELKNTYEQDKLKEQEREARESLQTLLEQRLQAVKKDKESLDPNEFSSIGVNAKSVKIEAGEIINTSLIEAGYTTIIGDSVLNKNGIIVSREDLNIQAKDFKNFGADLIAGNDLTIKADKVEIGTNQTGVLGKTERHKTSNIKGGNNIAISSNTDAKFTSVNMEANNKLSISATNNVIFDVAQDKDFSSRESSSFSLNFSDGLITSTRKHTTTTITKTSGIGNSLKGGSISINAGKDLESYNMQVQSKGDIALNAGGNVTVGIKADQTIEEDRVTTKTQTWNTNNKTMQTQESTKDLPPRIVSSNGSSNDFVSGGNIVINSGGNSSFTSISLDANKKVEINSQGDVTFDTITKNVHTTQLTSNSWLPTYSKTDSVVQISNSLNGESVSINSGKNLTANNLGINAKNDVVLKADGDITLTTKEDKHHTQRFFTGKKEDKTDLTDYNVQAINGNNITISAGQNAHLSSVDIGAEKDLSISATGDVLLDTLVKKQVDTTKTESTKVKWFKTTKTTTTTITTTNTNIANSLSGNNVSISSGNDLKGFNVKAEAKENLALSAGNDLTLSTKADEKKVEEHKVEKSFGFQGHKEDNPIRKNVGVSLGYTETTTDTTTNIKTHNNQTLSANKISLTSGNQTKLESINTDSKELSITGKEVSITALSDELDQTINKKEEFWGIGASLGVNTYVPAIEAGIGFANTETTSTDTLYQTTTSSTNIKADNITITTANKNNKPQGNINIIGSNLNGGEINLTGKDVSIKAHKTEYKQTHTSTTKTKFQTGMQVGVGVNGVTVGMDLYGVANILDKTLELASVDLYELPPQKLNTNYQESSGTTHTGSTISGTNITINAKNDANLIGSSIHATGDTTITGKNVNVIASVDTKTEYGYEFGYGINSNIGSSNLIYADVRVDGYAEGQAYGSASTNVNNSSITSGNLTINTKKGFLDPLNGNVNIIGGNLNANNVNMNVKGDLNIGSIQSHSASGKADLEAKTGSILSVIAFQPIDINGNIQGNLNATIKEQSGIKADKVNITTNRNTSLSNAYISATDKNSSIQTNTMTKLDFKDIYLGLNQNVDVRGLLGIDSWIKLGVNFSELKNNITSGQIVPVIEQIADIAKLNVGGKGWIGGITVSHPSTISQNIKVKIGKNKEEPKNIFRGEANEAKKVETLKPLYNSNGKFWVKK